MTSPKMSSGRFPTISKSSAELLSPVLGCGLLLPNDSCLSIETVYFVSLSLAVGIEILRCERTRQTISVWGGTFFFFFCGWSLCVGLGAEMQGNDGGLQFIRVVSSTRYQDETKARVLGPRASPLIG